MKTTRARHDAGEEGGKTASEPVALARRPENKTRGGDMIRSHRRSVLKAGVAIAGTYALGFPAIGYGQSDKIKVAHLTPLTGFLGALGEYAVLGIQMAAEEI